MVDTNGQNNQKLMFEQIDRVLKPGGRFVAVDVGAGTSLAKHFETSVKQHCLIGHQEKWLSPERLQGELIEGSSLRLLRAEIVPVGMVFDSTEQMALFMKDYMPMICQTKQY